MISDKYLQAFAHFYRGEMNRLTCYRTRLDSTFQFCIILVSGLLIFYLQEKIVFKYFPLYLILLTLFFCFIEARRYRYYLICQYRVSMMERGFLCDQILYENNGKDWKKDIFTIYNDIEFTKPFLKCFAIRYFRNYIWIVDLIVCLWYFFPPNMIFYYTLTSFVVLQHLYFIFFTEKPDI